MAELSSARKVVYWAVLSTCAVAAAWRLLLAGGDPLSRVPDTPESAQDFICRVCGQVSSLTPLARAKLLKQGGRITREEMTAVRHTFLPCPACGEIEAVVARSCPKCRAPFSPTSPNGRRHAFCPNCEPTERRPEDDTPTP